MRIFCLASCLCLAPLGLGNTYNVVTDFSSSSNPNGVWTYEAAGTPYPLSDGFSDGCGGPGPGTDCLYWSNLQPAPNGVSMLENISGSALHPNGTTYVPANYLNIDPQGLSAQIVFTAPASGNYQIGGQFLGNDVVGNPHPVSVVENGTTSLFSGNIGFYNQTNPFDVTVPLNMGDTIAFEVGAGSAGCYFCFLSTGLWAEVTTSAAPIVVPAPIENTSTPEPRMLPILGGGLGLLALAGVWKRYAKGKFIDWEAASRPAPTL